MNAVNKETIKARGLIITNAVIREVHITLDGYLTATLLVDHEDWGTQSFGTYQLSESIDGPSALRGPNYAGRWLIACMRAGGVDDYTRLTGKAIRVVREGLGAGNLIRGIGHIVKNDRWFIPGDVFESLGIKQ